MGNDLLGWVLAAVAAWIVIGLLGFVRPRSLAFVSHGLFPLGAAVGLVLAVVGLLALGCEPEPGARTIFEQ